MNRIQDGDLSLYRVKFAPVGVCCPLLGAKIHLQKECVILEEYIECVRKQADEILKCMRSTFATEKKTRGLVNKDFVLIDQ